jgi:hypothetical protein
MKQDSYPEASRDARKQVHEIVQSTNDSQPDLDGSILTNWVLIAEWSDVEGERWLSRLTGCSGGEDSPPNWQSEGMLHHCLYAWPPPEKE